MEDVSSETCFDLKMSFKSIVWFIKVMSYFVLLWSLGIIIIIIIIIITIIIAIVIIIIIIVIVIIILLLFFFFFFFLLLLLLLLLSIHTLSVCKTFMLLEFSDELYLSWIYTL